MAKVLVRTTWESEVALDDNTIAQLDTNLRGELIQPEDDAYESARQVYNAMIDKHPRLIARCIDVADVITCVNFARENGLLLAVRGGGHNGGGLGTCDNGMVLDLGLMKGVRVDPESQTVRVEGGCTQGEVDHAASAFGLAVPSGTVSGTGIAGLTLGGGHGYLTRKYGLTIDNLLEADVVTADGHLVVASADRNEDLFWAIRGGGGNFGVVTTFEFLAHPVGPEVWFLTTIYPIAQARTVLKFLCDYMADASEHLGVLATLWNAPQDESIAPEHQGEPVVILLGCWSGPFEEGEEVLRPLREIVSPVADLSGPRRYLDVQRFFDADYPNGRLYYWKSAYLTRVDDEVIDALVRHAQTRPSPLTSLDLWFLGGALNRVPVDRTAYARRDARFAMAIESNWTDPEQSDANIAWSRRVFDDMQRFSHGSYLNFPGFVEDRDKLLREAYGPNLDRLWDAKARYDPENLFQGLLNIPPA